MKHADIIEKLTLQEKVRLVSGDGPWHTVGFPSKGVPSIMMTDGPHGLRKQGNGETDINDSTPATCFPAAVTSGATWNRELIARMARAIGEEALAEGVSVVLGPGVNIKRNPKCGRNFEYFSEDPYLAGEMASSYINGLQQTGVGTSIKHFAANSQEYKRFNSDSQVDERTLREIYLRAFEIAVKKASPRTIMAAYCRLNGEFCTCNKRLLTDILRKEWGYGGLVVSDWGAVARHVDAIKAGCDLAMPGGSRYEDDVVEKAAQDGTLPMSALDECCDRVIDLALKGEAVRDAHKGASYDKDEHDKIAKETAAEGMVLLKNGGALPIASGGGLLLVGYMAQNTRYQGAGSSHIVPTKLTHMTDVLQADFVAGYDEKGDATDESIAAVKAAARDARVVIVAAGLPAGYESEGFDRKSLDLPAGINRVVEAAASVNDNVVVVLMAGGAVLLPWLDKVNAALFAGLCGQSGARAICDVLMGRVNPSGHLTETWPLKAEDVISEPFFAKNTKNVEYREGLYAGYRYYEKANVPVRFPFGHGLSYTQFEYSDLKVRYAAQGAHGDGAECKVSLTVKNTGDMGGAEVVQVYVAPPKDSLYRAVKELRGFEKVYLEAGESKVIDIALDDKSFCVYSMADNKWVASGGEYIIMAGSSVQDIRLECKVTAAGAPLAEAGWIKDSWYSNPAVGTPSRDEWQRLMECSPATSTPLDLDAVKKGDFGMDSTLKELAEQNKAVRCFVEKYKERLARGMNVPVDSDDERYLMAVSCTLDCALHGMVIMGGGTFEAQTAKALLDAANGKCDDRVVYDLISKLYGV